MQRAKTQPKMSIVMAVYNGKKYLKDAIDSVLQQSFTNYEFIIVDDCSTDSTPSIISLYNDNRIRYIRNKENLGQTPSLNIALKISKGKYIARIDGDDIYIQDKLKIQYYFMEKNPDVAVCGTAGERIDENGNQSGFRLYPQDPKDIYFRIFYQSPINHVSVIMRRSVVIDNGGYDEKYPYCADFALWSKLIKNNYKIVNLPNLLVQYRVFEDSLGAINKVGPSGNEAVNIIHSNISEKLNIKISRKECWNIIYMLWPTSGIDLPDILNAYNILKRISQIVYKKQVPVRILLFLNTHLLKSLIKRNLFLKSKRQFRFHEKELLKVIRRFIKSPLVVVMVIVSNLVVLVLNEENINKLKN